MPNVFISRKFNGPNIPALAQDSTPHSAATSRMKLFEKKACMLFQDYVRNTVTWTTIAIIHNYTTMLLKT